MPQKIAGSAPRPPFGPPEVTVAVRTSLLSCRKAGKPRISSPVRESSGESRLKCGGRRGCRKKLASPQWPLPKIILGIKFTDGIEIVRSQASNRCRLIPSARRPMSHIGDKCRPWVGLLLVHGIGKQLPGAFLGGFRDGFTRLLGADRVVDIVRHDPVEPSRRIHAAAIEL